MNAIKGLEGKVMDVKSVSPNTLDEMYKLMTSYYDNVNKANFQRDLSEKKDVILLRDLNEGTIKGFSTLMILEQKVDGDPITALFSGDTIVDKEYWGTNELQRCWTRYVFSLIDEMPNKELYWFLLSKGYKTYRYLPVFFNEFNPRRGVDFPSREKGILDAFAYSKFPQNYDSKAGVVSFLGGKDHLKRGVADIDESRLGNPDIRYFVKRNPGWKRGDELACLVRLTKDNFRRVIY